MSSTAFSPTSFPAAEAITHSAAAAWAASCSRRPRWPVQTRLLMTRPGRSARPFAIIVETFGGATFASEGRDRQKTMTLPVSEFALNG